MSDNLDKYIPEFDESEVRNKLSGCSREELVNMLVYSYKLRRVIEKRANEDSKKLQRIQDIVSEPSSLPNMPGIPTADDLRRMIEDDEI
jgi:hypothetical protein